MDVAHEELERHGQRLKRSIKGGGHTMETGTELMVNRLGEHHITFSVAFQGDQEGAIAATDRWYARVQTFGGIGRIGHVSLRGTDGTNAHVFDEETEAQVAGLDEETLAMIDQLMDPDAGDERSGH